MLHLSKISLRNKNLQEVDMSAIAESIVAELKTSAPERNVDVHIDKGMKARADNNLIRIALKNLVGNAWKYTSNSISLYQGNCCRKEIRADCPLGRVW